MLTRSCREAQSLQRQGYFVLQAALELHRAFQYHHSGRGETLGAQIALGDTWDEIQSHPKDIEDQ